MTMRRYHLGDRTWCPHRALFFFPPLLKQNILRFVLLNPAASLMPSTGRFVNRTAFGQA